MRLDDAGNLWFVATLKTAAGEAVDQGFFRIGGCDGFLRYGLGASPFNTLSLSGKGSTDLGQVARLEVGNVADPALTLVALSLGEGLFPFFDGVGLIDPLAVVGELLVATATGGLALYSLPIPDNPNLVGASFYLQAGSPDPIAPSGLVLSNGLRLTVCP